MIDKDLATMILLGIAEACDIPTTDEEFNRILSNVMNGKEGEKEND